MTMTTIDLDTVERISSPAEAEQLALAAYDSLIADLQLLGPEDWESVAVCAPWTVADMARHVLGAAKGTARTRTMLRRLTYGTRTLGCELSLDAATDGRLVEDVVKEWTGRHGQPFELALTGVAGRRYRRGSHGPVIQLDAIDFCWILSGRADCPESEPGADLLAYRVLF